MSKVEESPAGCGREVGGVRYRRELDNIQMVHVTTRPDAPRAALPAVVGYSPLQKCLSNLILD